MKQFNSPIKLTDPERQIFQQLLKNAYDVLLPSGVSHWHIVTL